MTIDQLETVVSDATAATLQNDNRTRQKVREFMRRHGMYGPDIDVASNCERFLQDMRRGLADASRASVCMLPTFVETEREVPYGRPVAAMDIGGTNTRVAVIEFREGAAPIVSDYSIHPTPGMSGAITAEEFFNTLAEFLRPAAEKSSAVGITFSFAALSTPDRDGRVLKLTKQLDVADLVGETVGERTIAAMADRYGEEYASKKFVVLNDTVATMLNGKVASPGVVFDDYVGFVLGTGVNTCYAEEVSRVTKLEQSEYWGRPSPGRMVINIESGSYNFFPRGDIDAEQDVPGLTADPGESQFEKLVSGKYHGRLSLAVVRRASEEGLFSASFARRVADIPELDGPDAGDFLQRPFGESTLALLCAGDGVDGVDHDEDRRTLYYLLDYLGERAAKLVAISLIAVLLKADKGHDPCRPVGIAIDGSRFYQSKNFRDRVNFELQKHLTMRHGIFYELLDARNGTLIGSAVAALINCDHN